MSRSLSPSMFRILLTIIATMPMLLPSGMCPCQWLPCGRASSDGDHGISNVVGAETIGGDCCDSCGVTSSTLMVHETGDSGEHPPRHSAPLPGKHTPCCPALLAANTIMVELSAQQVQCLLLVALEPFLVPSRPLNPTTPTGRVAAISLTQPLFISYCSIRI